MPTHTFMELALDEAHAAADAGEVPIGCVIVCDGDLIAQPIGTSPASAAACASSSASSMKVCVGISVSVSVISNQ